jgi:hypothetical protein
MRRLFSSESALISAYREWKQIVLDGDRLAPRSVRLIHETEHQLTQSIERLKRIQPWLNRTQGERGDDDG